MHGVLWGHCITSVRKDGNTLDDLGSKARFVMTEFGALKGF